MNDTVNHVKLDVIIPTLGTREALHGIIETLASFQARIASLTVRVFVSFNPKNTDGWHRSVYLRESYSSNSGFEVIEIGPSSYEPTTEHHILWCLKWHKSHCADDDTTIWVLTDNDPLIGTGFDAIVGLLRKETPDLLFVNYLWGDVQGEVIPSPAFRCNRLVWRGSASYFFRSQGFEHATSGVGSFLIRAAFLTEEVIGMYERTLSRSIVCAHAWWLLEAGMSTDRFYFVATPAFVNKMNPHNHDDSWVWIEVAEREGVQAKFSWTVGYLRHLDYYVRQGKMTWREIRTSIISEPQRGILLFLDDILRQLFVQAKLALRRPGQRFNADDINLIKRVWSNVYPLRMPMINFLCDVMDERNEDKIVRLRSYKLAIRFNSVEQEQGIFFPLFRNAMHGYYYLEHNSGFVAVLDKSNVHMAYRDLDPLDRAPFILYASTEDAIIEKIIDSKSDIDALIFHHNYDYWSVQLRPALNPVLKFPDIQLWILSQPETAIRMLKKLLYPASFFRRNIGRLMRLFRA
ncbi:hypothetical protein [Paraburkholderia caballeronis]|uniref:hypothetical protein n=1 Tax=Paraburkholderia caballeronis TaxID=416943 RepID=UPI00106591BA|nr:hypothetical protein [Paraburkholderia caballeronis]